MASRIALITFVDDEPGHISGGPVYPPGHPSAGFPVAPGHPGNALPWGPGHISGGPVYPPGHPSAGLPIAPGLPGNDLPGKPAVWPPVDAGGKPVDPAWGYSPSLGWILVYCGAVETKPVPVPEPKSK